MSHKCWLFGCLALICAVLFSHTAYATPILALKDAENCSGCHKPGRTQRPVLQRRCTLDCQGCHVDPAGGGARNQWGYYYLNDQLAAKNFFKPIDPLADKSRFDVHFDSRVIQHRMPDGSERTFPMSSEFTLRVRPFIEHLHFIYTGLLLGRVDDSVLRMTKDDERRYTQKYAVMLDGLWLNTYVRAYRGQPMYGLRRPNHSLWIRERIGLDQFATTEAAEIGLTPNVPFFRASYMKGDPNVEVTARQKGFSFHGGLRGVTKAWHVNTSYWRTASDLSSQNMSAVGGGFNAWKIIGYGERNWRKVTQAEERSVGGSPLRTWPSSTIDEYSLSYAGLPGVIFGTYYEILEDQNLSSRRRSVHLDFRPIPYLQVEFWRRFETGTRKFADTVGVAHLYFDM